MGRLRYYSLDGKLQNEFDLDIDILENTASMMSRCYLKNGNILEGYTNPMHLKDENKLILWTQEHDLAEEQEVDFDDIESIDCILHSHPRWGTRLMNHFEFKKKPELPKSDEKHFYIYVEYIDMENDRMYCYTSDDETIKKDDYVLVKRNSIEIPAKVINTKYYTDEEAPYPYSKLKRVIKKLPPYKYFVKEDFVDYYDGEYDEELTYVGINENEYIELKIDYYLSIKYLFKIYKGTDNGEITDEDYNLEYSLSEEKFDKLIDKIKEKRIDRWDKEYVDHTILDGYTWNLKINAKDIKLNSHGINKTPKNFDDLLYLLDINGIPVNDFDGPFNDNFSTNTVDKKKCACCEEYTLDEDSIHEICSNCGWESDLTEEEQPNSNGGANKMSLNDAKELYRKQGTIQFSNLNVIKSKDGRFGTIMLILHNGDKMGVEVEFDDDAPKTETIDIGEIDFKLNNCITVENAKLLDKYDVDYKGLSKKEILIRLDDVMTDYLDDNDEPTEEYMNLEKLYDEIYNRKMS